MENSHTRQWRRQSALVGVKINQVTWCVMTAGLGFSPSTPGLWPAEGHFRKSQDLEFLAGRCGSRRAVDRTQGTAVRLRDSGTLGRQRRLCGAQGPGAAALALGSRSGSANLRPGLRTLPLSLLSALGCGVGGVSGGTVMKQDETHTHTHTGQAASEGWGVGRLTLHSVM